MKNTIEPSAETRTVSGIIFWPAVKPKKFYPSVAAWAAAGHLDGATIYDSVDALRSCGVPIVDGQAFRGIYTRLPQNLPPQKVKVRVHKTVASHMRVPNVHKVIEKKVLASDVKDHHRMNY